MIDRLFAAILTFCVLIGGTLAIGAAMFDKDRQVGAPQASVPTIRVVHLDRVVVTAKRAPVATTVALGDLAATPTP